MVYTDAQVTNFTYLNRNLMQSKSADRFGFAGNVNITQCRIQWNILNIKGYGVYEIMQTDERMHTSARRALLGSGIFFTKQGV